MIEDLPLTYVEQSNFQFVLILNKNGEQEFENTLPCFILQNVVFNFTDIVPAQINMRRVGNKSDISPL